MTFDPDALLAGCRARVTASTQVQLSADAADAVEIPTSMRSLPPWNDTDFGEVADPVAWLIAYNAVNYSYWTDDPTAPRWWLEIDATPVGQDDEALAVMARLAREPVADPAWLERADAATVLAPAPGASPLPLLAARTAALHELGQAIRRWGPPADWVGSSALELTATLVQRLPSWADRRCTLEFHKRAQLCVSMIHGRLGGVFTDATRLTAFADYRLPQILRGLGVLELSESLSERIASHQPVQIEAEIDLRAAAVVGTALLAEAHGLDPLVVDHFLWRTAVDRQASLPPFHRYRCTDY